MRLDDQIKKELVEYLRLMEGPVQFEVSFDEQDSAQHMLTLLEEITALSPLLSIRHTALPRTPSFKVSRPNENIELTFAGIPSGHHFSSLVLAILQVSGRAPKWNARLVERVQKVDRICHFETYVSLGCPHCPDVVQILNVMAILNANISHTTIDGALFKEEVRDRQIMNVPAIYLNGEWFGNGRFSLEQILQKLGESDSHQQIENHEPYDVLVIGGGPAGTTAALYAARHGVRTGIVAERFGGHVVDSISVEQMVGMKDGDRARLVANLEEFVFDYGIDVWNLQRAKQLLLQSPLLPTGQLQTIQVTLENGTILQSKTVIVASGTSRQNLNIPGEMEFKNKGVSHCAECVGPLYENKHVAIIGGGQSGLEAAQSLSSVARHVTVLELQPALTASEPLQKKVRQLANVTLLCNVQVQEINGKHTVERLKYLETSSNTSRELQIDGLIVHIGRVPNTQWLDARIQRNHLGEIMVDPYGATNIPGVYATGDCTDQPYKQLIISLGNGATTALHAVQFLQNNENEPA